LIVLFRCCAKESRIEEGNEIKRLSSALEVEKENALEVREMVMQLIANQKRLRIQEESTVNELQRRVESQRQQISKYKGYGWTGQQPSSGFCDLAPSILHYNWF
jgi:hypothetical protein